MSSRSYSRYVFLTFLILTLQPSFGDNRFPGRSISKPKGEVEDAFFAYAIGILDSDAYGWLDYEQLLEVLPEFEDQTGIPFEYIEKVSRRRAKKSNQSYFTISFIKSGLIPIPVSILGGHPGDLDVSENVVLKVTKHDSVIIKQNTKLETELDPFYVFEFYKGHLYIDIADVLDFLLAGWLDDMYLEVFAIYYEEGQWYGVAAGHGYRGQVISAIFDFKNTKLVFPVPRKFRGLAEILVDRFL